MRPTPRLAVLAAALAAAAPASGAPSWSLKTLKGSDWCQVKFLDEFGSYRKLWCPASECCASEAPERKGIPLYLFESSTHPDVTGIPFYKATTSVYSAERKKHGVVVRRDVLKSPLDIVDLLPEALSASSSLVVQWTSAKEKAPPVTPMAEGRIHKPCVEYKRQGDYGPSSDRHWFKPYFLPLEVELVHNLAFLEGDGVKDLLGCPAKDCGSPGARTDVASGNSVLIKGYAKSLRSKVRAAAAAEAKKTPGSGFSAKFTAFEAGLLHCLVTEAVDAGKIKGKAFRKELNAAMAGSGKDLEDFVTKWRRYLAAELLLYGEESKSAEGPFPDFKDRLEALAARVGAVTAGRGPSEVFKGTSLGQTSAKVDEALRGRVRGAIESRGRRRGSDKAGDWAEGLLK